METLQLENKVRDRIASMLDALPAQWSRSEQDEPTSGPQSNPRSEKVVTYQVGDGPLEGTWSARGEDADLRVFDQMLEQLDQDWRYHLGEYGRIAKAMRSVGK